MSKYVVARSKFLLPISDKIGRDKRIRDGYILIKDDKIIEVGEYNDSIGKHILDTYRESLEIIGSNGSREEIPQINGVMLPGFVKAHGHDHESPIIGVAKDVPLTPWLDRAVNLFTGFMNSNRDKLEEHFNKSPNLIAYLKARVDDLYYGITSCMVHHCNHNKYRVDEIVEANRIANTKMIVAIGSQDRNYAKDLLDIPHTIALERVKENYEKHKHEKNTQIIPGPDQLFSNGPELLKAIKAWSREHNTLIHIHSSEEPNTTKWFRKEYGMTPIEYAKSIDFLDENTVVAHQVNCTDHDLEILRDTQTKVVHNPLANTILGSGMPPVIKMLEMGIDVVISTDGSGSADNQNIIAAARLASQYQKALNQNASLLPAQQVLEMITIEPAKVLKYNCGSLEEGKDADVVILDLSRPNMIPTRLDNLVENIIWAADGTEAQYVIANGKLVKDNHKVTGLNTDQILREVQELSEMFAEYAEKTHVVLETGAQGKN
ncbi:MAG: amidohydrolase family protein [Cyanobacteriota bacterium]